MNFHLILFCIFCQHFISGQSRRANSDSSEESNSFEERNFTELSALGLSNANNIHEDNEQSQEANEDNPEQNEDNPEQNEDEQVQYDDDKDEENEEENQNDKEFADNVDKTEKEPGNKKEHPAQYKYEVKAGDMADLFATNKHKYVPQYYNEFGRRFVLKYPINKKHLHVDNEAEAILDQAIKKSLKNSDAEYLIPQKGPPELVLAVAKKSALLEARKPRNPSDELMKRNSLRSGDFWNGVWKEDVVVPKKVLRSKNKSLEDVLPELETVRVKIMPGSKLHEVVSVATQISPRLLYIVNNKYK